INIITNYQDNNLVKKCYKELSLSNELEVKDNQDIVICGIGIIRVKNATKIQTNIPLESIEVRNSIFGGYYE
ncbi:MAG: hypothetical protein K5666_00515, partial [Bacilli bacterium]|nr:hypothetical protein [Bacilli bacterium]